MSCESLPVRALTRVDLPTPLEPSTATVAPSRTCARSASSPSPVRLLTTCTGTLSEIASTASRARAASVASMLSLFVSTTTGCAPESNARTSSRSRRRSFVARSRACTMNTTSRFAAIVCASARTSSDDARRTSRDRRGSTSRMRSPSSDTMIQSPTATSAPMFRTRFSASTVAAAISLRCTQRNVLHPRSMRRTRPMSTLSLISPKFSTARRKSSVSPSSVKALCTMRFTITGCDFLNRVLDCPTRMSYNGILLHVTTTRHR